MTARSELPETLKTRPFTRAEALRSGVSDKALRGPAVRRLFQGVYVAADLEVTLVLRCAAALILTTGEVTSGPAVVGGVTGLALHGIDVGSPDPIRLECTEPTRLRVQGVQVSRVVALSPHHSGIAEPAACFVRACTELDLLDAVTAGDWLLHTRRCTRAEFESALNAPTRGARAARRAFALVRDRVESPRETYLRLALVLAGLPDPVCNLTLGDDDGPVGRVDLAYLVFKLLIEYEGDQHRTDRVQWNVDINRAEAFTDLGFTVVRVTAQRMRRPREVVLRVYAKLCERGYDGPPPTFDAEWNALFEKPRTGRYWPVRPTATGDE